MKKLKSSMKKVTVLLLLSMMILRFGSKAQTLELVADINTDGSNTFSFSSSPKYAAVLNSRVYFSAKHPTKGRELFSYDGTTTQLEADILVGSEGSEPQFVTALNDSLYFIAKRTSGSDTLGLFVYDGINAPVEIANLKTESLNGYPELHIFNGSLIYLARNPNAGEWELWSYDGSSTSLFFSIAGSGNFPIIRAMANLNGQLYFGANDIYTYNGVNNPTVAPNGFGFANIPSMSSYNNEIYFQHNDGTHGIEPWKYDGTNTPTLLADMNPGNQSSNFANPTIYNNELYFTAYDGTNASQLWKTDGTTITSINVNNGGYLVDQLIVNNGTLFFRAYTLTEGRELWSYNGTSAALVEDIFPGSTSGLEQMLASFQGNLIFGADDGTLGVELYKYDGTSTSLASNIYNGNAGSGLRYLTPFQNKIYFAANDGQSGGEIWYTDGQATQQLADINPGPGHSNAYGFFTFNNKLYFSANNGTQNNLYEYDGISPPVVSTDLNNTGYDWNGALYFSYDDGMSGSELWKYDGINPPTLVYDIIPGSSGSYPGGFQEFNGSLIFTASDSLHGNELWGYDGINPPFLIGDLNPGVDDSYAEGFTAFNGKLYFSAFDHVAGTELWEYDGVNAPSLTIDLFLGQDISGWPYESYPSQFTVMDNHLYFTASDSTFVNQLWKYDGGNTAIKITNYPSASRNFSSLALFDDKLYFWADSGNGAGSELYAYDGVSAPNMLPELNVGEGRSRAQTPSEMIELDGYVYLSAHDGLNAGSFGIGELYRFEICTSQNITVTQSGDNLAVPVGFDGYQWYDSNGPIQGATSSSFTATMVETYYCELTDADGCSSISNSVIITAVGVTEYELDANVNLTLYPNPSSGMIHIQSDAKIQQLEVISSTGQLVANTNQNTLDLSHLAAGVYIVKIEIEDQQIIRRLIKQ